MKLQVFDGGLNTRLAPQHIKQTEGVVYNNIDNERAVLESVKAPLSTDIEIGQYHTYFNAEREWVDFDVPTDSAEYQSVLYLADGVTKPTKYSEGVTYTLGIEPPERRVAFEVGAAPEPVNTVETIVTTATAGAALTLAEAHYYIVNTEGGRLSTAMYVKVDAEGATILATNVTTVNSPESVSPPGADDLIITFDNFAGYELGITEVYRFYDGNYREVGIITDFQFAVIDNTLDISNKPVLNASRFPNIAGIIQYAYTFYDSRTGNESAPSPLSQEIDLGTQGAESVLLSQFSDANDPQVDQIRLYRIGGNLTNFSLVTTLSAGTLSYYDQFTDTEVDGRILTTIDNGTAPVGLQFIVEAYAMLFGAVGSRLYFTPIGEPNNWPVLFFLEFSFEITGIAPVGSGILVFSEFATEIVLGTGPASLSKQPLAGDQGCLGHKSIQLIGNSAMWVSTDGICVSSGNPVQVISKVNLGKTSVLPKDSALHDQVYYVMDYDNNILAADLRYGLMFKRLSLPVSQLAVGADRLYGWADGRLLELFQGEEDLEFEYTSPRFFEGRATQSKLYKNVYFYIDGDIIIEMYIDDQLIKTKRFTGKDNFQLKVPQDDQRGFYIQFRLVGTGKVLEIYLEANANDE